MANLEEFLKERGIHEDKIRELVDDKIDESVLPLMPDETLKRYLPSYGDRLAAVAFCRTKTSAEDGNVTGGSVLSRLQSKLKMRKRISHSLQASSSRKISVPKPTRRIELGWMNYEADSNDYKQVRSQNGGGTRHLSVDKDMTRNALIEIGKNLFFPEGNSKKGSLSAFQFELRDFQLRDVGEDSVAELYDQSKVKLLRLYLFSKPIDTANEGSPEACPIVDESVVEQPENSATCPSTEPCESSPPCAEPCDSGTPTIVFNMNRPRTCEIVSFSENLPENPVWENCSSDSESLPDISPGRPRSLSLRGTRRRDSSPPENAVSVVSDMKHVIERLQQSVTYEKKNMINVDRQNVLMGAIIGFKRTSFNEWQKLDVKFSGESGIDDGGPSREFMRLCIRAIQNCSIFEGPSTQRQIALDYCASSQNKYEQIAKILAYIIVHGGPVPDFFSESFYSQIVLGLDVVAPTLDDVSDYDTRSNIRQIMTASDEDEFRVGVEHVEELVQMSGTMRLSLSLNTKQELAFALIKFVVIERKREVFKRFLSGLETCGLLIEVRRFPNICRGLFVHSPQQMDARSVDAMFEVQWSTVGSNRHRAEIRTQTYFRNWLQDIEDSEILSKLLVFVTGLDSVPPLGFHPSPTLNFNHPDSFETGDPRIGFPIANTCAIRLSLPIVEEYDDFCNVMTNTVQAVTTFTNH